MTEENEVLKHVVLKLFPGMKLYENEVPKEFKRPCFIFIEPEDSANVEELTKFMAKVTKTVTLYAFYEEGNAVQGDDFRQKIQMYLVREKKHLIPNSENRYLTVDSCSTDTNKVDCLIEFSFRLSRVVQREFERPVVEKIRHIINDIN